MNSPLWSFSVLVSKVNRVVWFVRYLGLDDVKRCPDQIWLSWKERDMLISFPVLGSLQLFCHLSVSCRQMGFAELRLHREVVVSVLSLFRCCLSSIAYLSRLMCFVCGLHDKPAYSCRAEARAEERAGAGKWIGGQIWEKDHLPHQWRRPVGQV